MVDVRDVAAAHTRILDQDALPRHHLMVGTWLASQVFRDTLRRLTGRRLPAVQLGDRSARAASRLGDTVQCRLNLDLGLSLDTLDVLGQPRWEGASPDDALGIDWRAPEASLHDTVAWLYDTGHLSKRQAGLGAGGRPGSLAAA